MEAAKRDPKELTRDLKSHAAKQIHSRLMDPRLQALQALDQDIDTARGDELSGRSRRGIRIEKTAEIRRKLKQRKCVVAMGLQFELRPIAIRDLNNLHALSVTLNWQIIRIHKTSELNCKGRSTEQQ